MLSLFKTSGFVVQKDAKLVFSSYIVTMGCCMRASVPNVENVHVAALLSFDIAKFDVFDMVEDGSKAFYPVRVFNHEGELVETMSPGSNGKISLPVSKWIEYAGGVTLDEHNDHAWHKCDKPGPDYPPYYRMTGYVVDVTLKVKNWEHGFSTSSKVQTG